MRTATKKQLIAACQRIGAHLFESADCIRINLPRGKMFDGGDVHSLDLYLRGWTRPEAYGDLLYDLEQMPVVDCIDPECDSCTEECTDEDFENLYGCERIA